MAEHKTFWKPKKGAKKKEHAARKRKTDRAEIDNKVESKKRDDWRCRWPHQTADEKIRCALQPLESSHFTHKGIGGDHGRRSAIKDLITLDKATHDDVDGKIGGKRKRIIPLTDKRGSGPCSFEEKRGGQWVEVGREVRIGVLEEKS